MLWKLIRAVLFGLLAMFALHVILFVLSAGMFHSSKTFKLIAFGWIGFLQRTLPNVTVNWNGILMVLTCSALLVLGAHWLCRLLFEATKPEATRCWQWRWTLAGFASLWLTFGIVMGTSGVARHMIWLIGSQEPFYKERINYERDMRMSAMMIQNQLMESRTNVHHIYQEAAMQMARNRSPLGLLERYQCVLLTDSSNSIHSALLIPREHEIQQRFGFVLSSDPSTLIPMDQLPHYLGQSHRVPNQ